MKTWMFVLFIGSWCVWTHAANPHREPVSFSYNWDVGPDRSVYVVGGHPDVGSWNPINAVRLYWTAGNNWTGQVAVQAGTLLAYKYIARVNFQAQHCEGTNVSWSAGPDLHVQVPAQPDPPYTGKTIYYFSSWTNSHLLYRFGTNDFVNSPPMERVGDGRSEGESLYRIAGIGTAGADMEFVMNGYLNSTQYWDNAPFPGYGTPPANNYFTSLDAFYLQDGHIYNYHPPAAVSAPAIIQSNIASSVSGIPARNVRIYLPRGYSENTWKRYPVLYMHDGQNIYQPGGTFGSWDVDLTATREISQGRAREVIIVGIDNSAGRMAEYCPPGDTITGPAGTGDAYMQYVVHNVRPTIDTHFRTLNDPDNTLIAGSSLGGLISTYMGLEGDGVFGKVGAFSPSYVYATNFVGRIASNDTHGIRIYIDGGTSELPGIWQIWTVYDHMLRDGYAPNADLKMVVECGTSHNEPAWAGRFPAAMRYLLPLWDEANLLLYDETELEIEDASAVSAGSELSVTHQALHGWNYRLERAVNPVSPSWTLVADSGVEPYPWRSGSLTDTNPPAFAVYRLVAESPAVQAE